MSSPLSLTRVSYILLDRHQIETYMNPDMKAAEGKSGISGFSLFFFALIIELLFFYIFISEVAREAGVPPRSAPCFRICTPQCASLNACRLSPTSPFTGSGVVDGPCCRPLHLAALIGREKFLHSTASTRPRGSVCSPGYGL